MADIMFFFVIGRLFQRKGIDNLEWFGWSMAGTIQRRDILVPLAGEFLLLLLLIPMIRLTPTDNFSQQCSIRVI
jgi:hypothetical protein